MGGDDSGAPRRGSGRRRGRGAQAGGEWPTAANPAKVHAADGDDTDHHERARTIVLDQLSFAPRSRRQLEEKLASRDCPPDVAKTVLDRMTEVGLVDDTAYAGMLVRSQHQGRGLARRALSQELRRKGIDPDTAQEALDQVGAADEEERARALVEKKLRTMHGLSAQVQTRRLAGMLARKGYGSSVSYQVIREALANADEHARD